MKRRLFALLAALLAALIALGSCATQTDGPGADGTEPAAGTTPEQTEAATEPEVTAAVEDLSYNGQPTRFNMLVRKNRYAYLYVEEYSGDLQEFAVYKRNSMLEEKYGIKFSITEGADAADFTTAMQSANPDYDLCVPDYWWNLELNGYFQDLAKCPEINPEDAWWYSGWNKNVTVNGRMYTIAGDGNLEMLENLEVMFFNKDMATDLGLNLYKTVRDGQWTVEKCIETAGVAAAGFDDTDISNDRYGILYDVHSADAQLYSCGMRLAALEGDTVSLDNVNTQNTYDIVEAVGKILHTTGVNYSSATARARDWSFFKDGSALIYATALYLGKSLKSGNLDFDYGIIPLPKMSEDSQYISTSYGVSVFAIPVSVSSVHNSALILNALNFHSARGDESLVTTFFDVVLKYQVANSPEDIVNLDLVRESVYIDFAFIYDVGLDNAMKNAAINGSSPSSAAASVLKPAKNTLKSKILSFYTK